LGVRRLGAVAALMVILALTIDGARAATPEAGTVSLADRTLH